MSKKIFSRMINLAFDRQQIIRLSRALMNRALGDNNDDIKTNGELFLLSRVLYLVQSEPEFVAFDVGANIGHWTNSFLDTAEKQGVLDKAIVHCFEPSSFTFSKLQTNFAKHPMSQRVFLANLGVSNRLCKMKLYIFGNGYGTNSFYKRSTESLGIIHQKTEVVRTTTLDAYCQKKSISHIDFLKIDVEGHELAVVQGARDMLKGQAIDYIQFEYGGCWVDSRTFFLDMYDLLTSFGYSIGKILPKGIEFYDKYDQRIETFQMANFLACKPKKIGRFKHIKPYWMM